MAVPGQTATQPAQASHSKGLHGQASHEMVCPDPSVHEKQRRHRKLQDQAADAALYVTHPARAANVGDPVNPLDAHGKLSSASAARSLKYARAQDLPSFPSVGLNTEKSAGAAAHLAASGAKVTAWPELEASTDARRAAVLAKNYKIDPLWQPEASTAGSKAAILAHKGQGRDWWQAKPSKDGYSAAVLAAGMKLSPDVNYGVTEEGRRKALVAATLSVRGRKRSDSTPEPRESYPDASKAGYNAHNAAVVADANRYGSKAMEASRITHLDKHINPKMFTEHPPIAWEAEDKKHEDSLQASAIAMAKKMYAMQQVDDDGNITIRTDLSTASTAHNRASSGSEPDIKQQALQYLSLQDAAQKLAGERLAKIQHPDEETAFRNYYGYPSRKARTKLSIRGRNRDRASSEGAPESGSRFDYDSDDEEQARRIRSQHSQFTDQLAAVDKKREQDRKALLAVAEKKVHAQMHALDKKVFDETGKMSPQMVEEWDAKARARAAANSEARMQHHGKVSIGGGKFLDRSEIDAIAQARIQPTLDQITDKAEKQRARDEETRLDAEERKRQTQAQKQRENELKAEQKRARHQEKQDAKTKKAEEKQAARDEKDAAKAKKSEEKRLAAEEKRKSKETEPAKPGPTDPAIADEIAGHATVEQPADEQPTTSATSGPLVGDAAAPAVVPETPEAEEPDREEMGQTPVAKVDVVAHRNASIDDAASVPATASTAPTPRPTPLKPTIATHDDTARKLSSSKDKEEPTSPKSPHSPTKRSFRSILHKLKPKLPSRKGKKREPGSFTGGAALTKKYPSSNPRSNSSSSSSSESNHNRHTTLTSATHAEASSSIPKANAPESSPSISSLSSSDRELAATPPAEPSPLSQTFRDEIGILGEVAEQPSRNRGRIRNRGKASSVSAYSHGDEFEEARDTLAPPPRPAFASGGIQKADSPSRESRFREEVD